MKKKANLVIVVVTLLILVFASVSEVYGYDNSEKIPHNLSFLLSNTGDGYDTLLNTWNNSASSITPPSNLSYLLSNTGDGYDVLLRTLNQSKDK